jgi:Sec-independent protein translocase protein TatA
MFGNIGWGELLVVGLVMLGPERLPGVIQALNSAARSVLTGGVQAQRHPGQSAAAG